MFNWQTYTIATTDSSTSATFVPARGGAASSIIMPGSCGPRELLFLHANFWDENIKDLPGGWPFCFPVCGRVEYQGELGIYHYQGKNYKLPIHGFAWQEAWQAEQRAKEYLILRLHHNDRTYSQYPFRFTVELHYRVENAKLVCEQLYRNEDDKPMPYYAGFHPYFLTPAGQDKSKVLLDYQPKQCFQYNARYTALAQEVAPFQSPISITKQEINQQLTTIGTDKRVALHFPEEQSLYLEAYGKSDAQLFPYIQLYTMAEQSFFCVEPWMAIPNSINTTVGVRWLMPGETEHGVLSLHVGGR